MGGNNYDNYLRYKWEILRRNEDYRQDFQRLQKQEISHSLMHERWGCYLDPKTPVDKKLKFSFPVKFTEEDSSPPLPYSRMFSELFSAEIVSDKQTRKPKRIIVDLNAEAPFHLVKDGLLSLFRSTDVCQPIMPDDGQMEEILDAINTGEEKKAENLEKKYIRRSQLPTKRINWKKIDHALKIFDLNKKRGMKPKEIAQELYPDVFNFSDDRETHDQMQTRQESVIREVKRYLRKAKEMIMTGKVWLQL